MAGSGRRRTARSFDATHSPLDPRPLCDRPQQPLGERSRLRSRSCQGHTPAEGLSHGRARSPEAGPLPPWSSAVYKRTHRISGEGRPRSTATRRYQAFPLCLLRPLSSAGAESRALSAQRVPAANRAVTAPPLPHSAWHEQTAGSLHLTRSAGSTARRR